MSIKTAVKDLLNEIEKGAREVNQVIINPNEVRFISSSKLLTGVKVRACLRDCFEDEEQSGSSCVELLKQSGCWWEEMHVYPQGDCAVFYNFWSPFLFKYPAWLTLVRGC